jgi:carbamoyl-phosphate synthase large subunit
MIGSAPAAPRWRVLVFPAGTEIALEVRQALAGCKDVALFGAGAAVSSHGPFAFCSYDTVPFVTDPEWADAVRAVVERRRITHVFPAHDDAVVALAEHESHIGAKVVGSDVSTCRVARSKRATMTRLAGIVPTPTVFPNAADVETFPVFVKPDRGQGSEGAAVAHDRAELDVLLEQDPTRVIFEHLPGTEYTVDCFSDRDRGLLYAGGRARRRIRAGIAMNAAPDDDPRFGEYATKIARALPLRGAWFFQLKADADGTLRVLEVAPRVAGTSGLTRARGINLPLLSLYESDRIPVTVAPGTHQVEIDRALVSRYRHNLSYRTLYVDFDDTLILHGKVNADLVKLLFQALNGGVRLVLLTRHGGDLRAALGRHRLAGLFDDVVHLRPDESKADHASDPAGLLIDDSFAERQAVRAARGIPVFDTSMIEVLFDDRV